MDIRIIGANARVIPGKDVIEVLQILAEVRGEDQSAYEVEIPTKGWTYIAPSSPTPDLNKRDLLQCQHALNYAEHFSNAYLSGHNQYMLIAKLARACGIEVPFAEYTIGELKFDLS